MIRFFISALVAIATFSVAHAQLPMPRLNSIFPCGAQQGTSVDCTIAGGDLEGATGLYFSHPGIRAEPAGPNKFKVSVAKNVPPGKYDVRVIAPPGLSNFRAFVVGDWPETLEKEPNDDLKTAQSVKMPVVVNGRVDKQTDVDHYSFSAKKGQRVLINCWAWRIDSQLDATLRVYDANGKELAYNGDYYGKDALIDFTAPADGDYIVAVWDFVYGGGSDYFYRLHIASLPHLDVVIPAAVKPGEKTKVTLYGRNLLGGKPAPEQMNIGGRPLEMITREIEAPADPIKVLSLRDSEAIRPARAQLDGFDYRVASPDGGSNSIFLAFATDPILVEQEPNNDQKNAQKLPIPCDLTGTFTPVNDVDFYSFTAKKGEKIVVEIFGERQSGQIDPYLAGFDAAGKRIFTTDDGNRNIGQIRFTTQTRDARWDFTATADGEYFVQVRDLYFQQRGEGRFSYRLCVHRPQPDFRLVAVPVHDTQPHSTSVGRNSKNWMDVLVFRNDGFDEPITVEAANLPKGVTCEPVIVGPGKTSVPLVFNASADAAIGHADIRIIGKAKIEGKDIERDARGGGLTWGTTNTPGIARMADGVLLAVREPAAFSLTATPALLTAKAGDKVTFTVKLARAAGWNESIQLSGFDMPQNTTMALGTIAKGANEGKVELVLPANTKPGTFTFTINGAGQVPRDYALVQDPKKPRAANVRETYPSNAIIIKVEGK
ncbi:MAG: PPC domain-containing protein [Planctomycetes bacterium]|nr:PPC domain-containing protein [Planctomycetota bacterium]